MPQAPATMITAIVDRRFPVTANVITAEASAKYTSHPARRSASFWIGARECSAFSTASMIRPKTVSRPTRSVRISKAPVWLVVPAKTGRRELSRPVFDSPVMLD